MNKKSNFFAFRFSHKLIKSKWTIKPVYKIILAIILLIFFVYAIYPIFTNFNSAGVNIFNRSMKSFFGFNQYDIDNYPGKSLWGISFKSLLKSIGYVLVANVIGTFLAIVTSIFCFKLLFNVIFTKMLKILLTILRSFPVVIVIMVYTKIASVDMIAILSFVWFTWLYLHKYFVEILENVETLKYSTLINNGYSKINSFYKTIWQVFFKKARVLSLYSFESNITWATILGAAGVAGIGVLIDNYQNTFKFIGIPITTLTIFLVLFHGFAALTKKYIISDFSTKNEQKILRLTIKVIKYVLILLSTFLFIYILFTLDYSFKYSTEVESFFKASLNTNWNGLFTIDGNIFEWLWELFKQLYSIVFIVFWVSILFTFLQIAKLNNRFFYYLSLIFNQVIRVIPAYIFVLFINPISMNITITFIIAISINSISSMIKKISDSINQKDSKKIAILTNNGMNKFIIYKIILLESFNDVKTFFSVEIESVFKDLIYYGIFGGSVLGHKLVTYAGLKKYNQDYNKLWSIIYVIMIVTILIEISMNIFRHPTNTFLISKKVNNWFSKLWHWKIIKLITQKTHLKNKDIVWIKNNNKGHSKNKNLVFCTQMNKQYFIHIPIQKIDHKDEYSIYNNYYKDQILYINKEGLFIKKYQPSYEFDLKNKQQIIQLFTEINQFHKIDTNKVKNYFGINYYLKLNNIPANLLNEFNESTLLLNKYKHCVLHGDLNHNNIIYNDKFYLIDFEWVSKGPWILDYASIIAYCETDIKYWANLLNVPKNELIRLARMLLIHGLMWANEQINNKRAKHFINYVNKRLQFLSFN